MSLVPSKIVFSFIFIFVLVFGIPTLLDAKDRNNKQQGQDIVSRYNEVLKRGQEKEIKQLLGVLGRKNTKISIKKMLDIVVNKKVKNNYRYLAMQAMKELCDLDLTLEVVKKVSPKKIKPVEVRRAYISFCVSLLADKQAKEVISLCAMDSKSNVKALCRIVKNKSSMPITKVNALQGLIGCNYDKEFVTKQLIGLAKKIKDPYLMSILIRAISVTASSAFLEGDAVSDKLTAVRAASYLYLTNQLKDEEKVDVTSKMKEAMKLESDQVVLVKMTLFLSEFLKQNEDEKELLSFLESLAKSEDPFTQSIALTALAQSGSDDKSISKLLKSNYAKVDWRARLAILDMINAQEISNKNLVFLVDCMSVEKGRLRGDIAKMLSKMLECDSFGLDVKSWRNAVDQHSRGELEDFLENSIVAKTHGSGYYGVPITSRRIVFILDKTGSMRHNGRMVAAKKELCKTLQSLDEDLRKKKGDKYLDLPKSERTYFTIQSFSADAQWWNEKMVPATTENIEKACEWVNGIVPSGMTYTDVALKSAFSFAEKMQTADNKKKKKDDCIIGVGQDKSDDVDTIFLVTDGMPNHVDRAPGGNETPEMKKWLADRQKIVDEIYAMVDSMYAEKKITLNCVGIMNRGSDMFLDAIAKKTKGRTVYVNPSTNAVGGKPGQKPNQVKPKNQPQPKN